MEEDSQRHAGGEGQGGHRFTGRKLSHEPPAPAPSSVAFPVSVLLILPSWEIPSGRTEEKSVRKATAADYCSGPDHELPFRKRGGGPGWFRR